MGSIPNGGREGWSVSLLSLVVPACGLPRHGQRRKIRPRMCAWICMALVIVAVASTAMFVEGKQSNHDSEESNDKKHSSESTTNPIKYECTKLEAVRDRGQVLPPRNNPTSLIPFEVLDTCGLAPSCRDLRPLGKSLAFVKTHKTGSSTISNLVNRMVDNRNLTKMIPKNNFIDLGWPHTFPGYQAKLCNAKVDAINNHAIWNAKLFAKYLRDSMFSFTILRDPMSRIVSAFNYFRDFDSWRECIEYLHSSKKREVPVVRYLNSMAFDLGWYEQYNPGNRLSRKFDGNTSAIRSFIRQLDQEMDVVLIAENMTESLLMLSTALPSLNPQELILYHMKHNTRRKIHPNATEMRELMRFLSVDELIYNHFKKKFLDWWEKNGQSDAIGHKKDALECLQHWADNHTDSIYAIDSIKYTKLLWKKQEPACSKKYGLGHVDINN